MLGEWVIVAPHRTTRPVTPTACPFCPSSGNPEVSGDWDVLAVPNRFGALGGDGAGVASPGGGFEVTPAVGATEVLLYQREHDGGLHALPAARLARLFDLWADREAAYASRPDVEYVFQFENRGAAVGVSQTHPHGQVFALPFVPALVQRMLERARTHGETTGSCVHCGVVEAEAKDGRRIVAAVPEAVAFVPFAPRLPYEVRVYPRRHVARIGDLTALERRAMGTLVGAVVRAYRARFAHVDDPSYILAHYPAPARGEYERHHYHVAFFPFQRNDRQIKSLGGLEFAGGSYVNDSQPEERAHELADALSRVGLPA